MPTLSRHYRPGPASAVAEPGSLARRFAAIRAELGVPGPFPSPVLAEAERVAARATDPIPDRTDLGFWTLDPAGSMDLDQALHLARDGAGYQVRYAIADLPSFVTPGGAIDTEARDRVQTIYLPDGRVPLHPPVLSEGAASLLPGQTRPAYVWELRLDADGELVDAGDVKVARALVRSRDRRDYQQAQASVDAGSEDEQVALLAEIGRLRIARERDRGGASLPMPEQQVVHDARGHYRLEYRPPMEAESWNAQISLLTGMAAAQLMLEAGVGILRTMPAPGSRDVRRFKRQARALGVPWSSGQRYGDFIRALDTADPRQLALVFEATSLFRGADYTPIDGHLPRQRIHAAVAAPYAHVTAPLRRLVDRIGLVVCGALSSDRPVPEWARAVLTDLPERMAEGHRRAATVERACTDAVETALLRPMIGRDLAATVVDLSGRSQMPVVQLTEPAVLARADGTAEPGDQVTVRVRGAEVETGHLDLAIVG
ncbi:MAG: ribonuclease II [Actinomycetales bacterium]|nr:MAG: ribonuclease II [Actinomycetales bacterium]